MPIPDTLLQDMPLDNMYLQDVFLCDYSPAMIWTVILSLMPSVGPQVYLS